VRNGVDYLVAGGVAVCLKFWIPDLASNSERQRAAAHLPNGRRFGKSAGQGEGGGLGILQVLPRLRD
jgi:hypothetical protein